MTAPLDPLDRPVGRLLRLAQVADPQQVVETLSMTIAELGGSDVVLFLVDYDQSRLKPHPDVLPHGEPPDVASLEGSMAGRVSCPVGRWAPNGRTTGTFGFPSPNARRSSACCP